MSIHDRDCAACDAARAVVTALREQYDPLDNWDEVSAEGRTQTVFTVQLVADVLHRYPLRHTDDSRLPDVRRRVAMYAQLFAWPADVTADLLAAIDGNPGQVVTSRG